MDNTTLRFGLHAIMSGLIARCHLLFRGLNRPPVWMHIIERGRHALLPGTHRLWPKMITFRVELLEVYYMAGQWRGVKEMILLGRVALRRLLWLAGYTLG